MNKFINLITVAILLTCAPVNAANKLPAGSALSYAMSYYQQHVIAAKNCPATVAINARNKSAILKAAMRGYAVAAESTGKQNHFADYFSAVIHSAHRCQSPLSNLPHTLITGVSKAANIPNTSRGTLSCPELEPSQKQSFELYLEALAAKVVWDTVNKHC